MKQIWVLGIMSVASMAVAAPDIDETFKTTFSDYGRFHDVVRCEPGYNGGYATGDIITIKNHAVELGLDVGHEPFRAYLLPPPGSFSRPQRQRTYAESCKGTMETLKKAIHVSELVEVEVHRTVERMLDNRSRVVRAVDGEVKTVRYHKVERTLEMLRMELAGIEFHLFQGVNGKVH